MNQEVKSKALKALKTKIADMGGRKAYQDARYDMYNCILVKLVSIVSTSYHKTCKWVFQVLTKLGLRPGKNEGPLNVLEVGAINTQLLSCPWLNVKAIDLISRHEQIEQIDFFSVKPAAKYDVLVSSMVLNCVPTPEKRGEMLKLYRLHLNANGMVFLMIPLLCLTNSKTMTYDAFVDLLMEVGFNVVESKQSPKVAFFCLKPIAHEENVKMKTAKKTHAKRKGNDFHVVL